MRIVVAELAQDGVGVLAERRDRVHARCAIRRHARRHEGGDRSSRAVDLRPAPSGRELGMRPDLVHVVHAGVGDAGRLQPGDYLDRRERCERRGDDRLAARRAPRCAWSSKRSARRSRDPAPRAPACRTRSTRARSAGRASPSCRRRRGTARRDRSWHAPHLPAAAAAHPRTRSTAGSSATRPCSPASTRRWRSRGPCDRAR